MRVEELSKISLKKGGKLGQGVDALKKWGKAGTPYKLVGVLTQFLICVIYHFRLKKYGTTLDVTASVKKYG